MAIWGLGTSSIGNSAQVVNWALFTLKVSEDVFLHIGKRCDPRVRIPMILFVIENGGGNYKALCCVCVGLSLRLQVDSDPSGECLVFTVHC